MNMSEEKEKYEVKAQDDSTIDGAYRIATAMAKTDMVPKQFQGSPTNCFLALQTAKRMNLDPLAVMQNLYVVHGTPAFTAKFLIGMANRSGVFKTPIMFRKSGEGDSFAVTAWAIHASSGEAVSYTFSMETAKAENYTKNPKYKSMPELMLSYRAATLLTRLYCPETAMGSVTIDEVEDMKFAKAEASPAAYAEADSILPEVETHEEVEPEVLPPESKPEKKPVAKEGELI